MVCSCISSILEAFLVECVCVYRERRGGGTLPLRLLPPCCQGEYPGKCLYGYFEPPVLPHPVHLPPGDHRAGLRSGVGDTPRRCFSSPPPEQLVEGHWLSVCPGIWGRCCLPLMLLCSMLNEARTFTQVTFIILLGGDTQLCTRSRF